MVAPACEPAVGFSVYMRRCRKARRGRLGRGDAGEQLDGSCAAKDCLEKMRAHSPLAPCTRPAKDARDTREGRAGLHALCTEQPVLHTSSVALTCRACPSCTAPSSRLLPSTPHHTLGRRALPKSQHPGTSTTPENSARLKEDAKHQHHQTPPPQAWSKSALPLRRPPAMLSAPKAQTPLQPQRQRPPRLLLVLLRGRPLPMARPLHQPLRPLRPRATLRIDWQRSRRVWQP